MTPNPKNIKRVINKVSNYSVRVTKNIYFKNRGETMNKGALLVLCFTLWGCKESIKGHLAVNQELSVKVKEWVSEDDPFCDEDFEDCDGEEVELIKRIQKGAYDITLSVNKYNKVAFKFRNRKLEVALPRNRDFPKKNGDFNYKASELGQNFDIKGRVKTDIYKSPLVSGREQCTYEEQEYTCWPQPNGQPRCGMEWRTRYGWRTVEYKDVSEHKSIKFSFLNSSDSTSVLAKFSGNKRRTRREYTYEGDCW